MRRNVGRVGLAGVVIALAGLSLTPGLAVASATQESATEQVLYSFAGPDGAGPLSGVVAGPGGVLYGSTDFGGAAKSGLGTVFALAPGSGGYAERTLVNFYGPRGGKPAGTVAVGSHGDLFGDTVIGGADGQGVVFELVPSVRGYREEVLYSFTGGPDGGQPIGAPVLDAHGDVFGVTQFGGAGGQGVIFELTPSAAGYAERVLHSFAAAAGQPQAGLTRAADGRLYGTLYGASEVNSDGTVFSLRMTRAGPVYTTVHAFDGADGANPFAALTVNNTTGVIYGTTQYGGSAPGIGGGTVFALTPEGPGYTEQVLHSFTTRRSGVYPEAPLLLTHHGTLYGTTTQGGTGCRSGCGVVFKLVPGPAGDYSFRLAYAFAGAPDGNDPVWSGLAAGPDGQLFGTTRSGGTSTTCTLISPGCGTVYQITP